MWPKFAQRYYYKACLSKKWIMKTRLNFFKQLELYSKETYREVKKYSLINLKSLFKGWYSSKGVIFTDSQNHCLRHLCKFCVFQGFPWWFERRCADYSSLCAHLLASKLRTFKLSSTFLYSEKMSLDTT